MEKTGKNYYPALCNSDADLLCVQSLNATSTGWLAQSAEYMNSKEKEKGLWNGNLIVLFISLHLLVMWTELPLEYIAPSRSKEPLNPLPKCSTVSVANCPVWPYFPHQLRLHYTIKLFSQPVRDPGNDLWAMENFCLIKAFCCTVCLFLWCMGSIILCLAAL